MDKKNGTNAFDIAPLLFGWLDYSLFGLVLLASTAVGVYYGFFNKQTTKVEYLLGGKSMNAIPVALSLVACHISGVTVMGVPSEVYIYGSQYILVCVSCILVAVIANYVYLPVFFDLQLTSTYEYLEMRFSRRVRVMASVLYTIAMLLYVPIVVYVPALAFSQVSGVGIHFITPIVCVICIFYTMLGGFKAVVWTDIIQISVMLGSGIAVLVMGANSVGGFETVMERAREGGRVKIFEMDPSPMVRSSFWTVLIGTTFLRTANMVNQGSVQKFLSLPRKLYLKTMLVFYCIGIIIMKVMSVFMGLIIYAAYYNCDPIQTKAVKRPDQLLAYFVMDAGGTIPGFPGLFIAGVFSASLSSMASGLNCLAATIYEDFVRPCLKGNENERQGNIIMRTIVLVVGIACVFLVVIVEKLGGVLEISYSAQGITCGALLGLFSLGIFFPWANEKGALCGSISSLLLVGWIVYGAQNAIATGSLVHKKLPTSTDGCYFNTSNTISRVDVPREPSEQPFMLYRISYWYYGVIGTLTVVIVGMIVSAVTGLRDPRSMDKTLIAPFLRNITRKNENVNEEMVELTEKDDLNTTPRDEINFVSNDDE